MPDVIFDIEQRRNYHLREGQRVWHEVPRGYEFDADGRLWLVDIVRVGIPLGGFLPCEDSAETQQSTVGSFDAIEEPTDPSRASGLSGMAAESPEVTRGAEDTGKQPAVVDPEVLEREVKKHGRSNRST